MIKVTNWIDKGTCERMDDEWTICIFRQKNIWLVWKYKHQKYNDMGVRRKKGKSPMASDIYTNINTFIYLLFFSFLLWMSSVIWTWLQQWTPSNCATGSLVKYLQLYCWQQVDYLHSSPPKTIQKLMLPGMIQHKMRKKKKKKKIYIHKCVHMCMTKEWTGDIDFPSWSPLGCARRSPQNEKSIHWIKVMQNGWLVKMAAGFIFSAP